GQEDGFPPEPFAAVFGECRSLGLLTVAHAGEFGGIDNLWRAVRSLKPHRIGHALPVTADPRLVDFLLNENITVETCPWSNVLLNACTTEEHPVVAMLQSGLSVVIASDDPGIFRRSLAENYL